MFGYFGTAEQKALQQRIFESRQQIADTPGLFNGGRLIGADDLDKVGWDTVLTILQRDGVFGMRLISPEQTRVWFPRLEAHGYRIDTWTALMADAARVRPAIAPILEQDLPDGLHVCGALGGPEGADTTALQQFMVDNGVSPFPGALLVYGPGQASVVIADRNGALAACSYTYFGHNTHSAFHRYAFVGLVAVAPALRGTGLGRLANAMAIQRAIEELGAESVYEFVAATNVPSRRMVEACGLVASPDRMGAMAVPAGKPRFTR